MAPHLLNNQGKATGGAMQTKHEIRFWGVRGSIPCPNQRAGGNTSCIEIKLGDQHIIIDGGTGITQLAQRHKVLDATILFTHFHWDHIQGVPFCGALYHPQSRVQLVGPAGLERVLRRQMSGPNFPVGMDAMQAELSFGAICANAALQLGNVLVTTCALNHPGGSLAYRISHGARSIVIATDHEHGEPRSTGALLALAQGADVLVYDAQYLPDEYPQKRGWGHSTYQEGVQIAKSAGVKKLVLTHHDPARSDEQLLDIELRARHLFDHSWVAREGLAIPVAASEQRAVPAGDSPKSAHVACRS
jgi:phosphoribosyl 1,2-cyclic phosphodiesterase